LWEDARIEADVHRHALGLTWTVREPLARASHAVVEEDRLWLVDPVDHGPALEAALALGAAPAGVLQLLDRHGRDAAAIAGRLGIPHHRLPDGLPGTALEILRVVDVPGWRERALWWPARRALVVPEAVGTVGYFAVGRGPVGVHPFLRPLPPRGLAELAPDHLLVGHGAPRSGPETAEELREAVRRSRRDLANVPRALLRR